ncbi:MAG: glycosyltransferase [Deltaproteobacteria bacterium]|nr:glycosyltransferase [Deltaproteobacteria bacterium]
MKIAVLCNDTRGGVQPYVALAMGLRDAGHDVRAVAPSDLAPMFSDRDIPVAPLSGSIEAFLRASQGAAEGGTLSSMRLSMQAMPKMLKTWTQETLDACEFADILTGGIGGMIVGEPVAEKLKRPFVQTHLQPLGAPTDRYPGVLLAKTPALLGAWGRRVSHTLCEAIVWGPFRSAMKPVRREVLGLASKSKITSDLPVIYGISPHVVPIPNEGSPERIATGYWTLPDDPSWAPSPELRAFVERDGPLVSVGFGSMTSADASALTALVINAVRSVGARVLLLSGWAGVGQDESAPDVMSLRSVPHSWLFAKTHANVHHGGAGTTGASLRAGVPSLVIPFMMDQPFWGGRVQALGAGPAPIPRKQLTQQKLSRALAQCLSDDTLKTRARELGHRISAEDGVHNAVQIFSRL